ncbi:hypothetical protein HYC85_006822 [Camellia sinensis]|uniref:Mitochondrial import inner membrane translocase subunit TIM50 n=1 Tax=Camellia sinensis TaxID=4442 RepID=A0A7J7HPP0_CAMSI|nr:hypothetical protein HYC85_006822 [Camellia sinensis]
MAGKLPSLKAKAVIYENSSDDDNDDNKDTGNDNLGLSLEKHDDNDDDKDKGNDNLDLSLEKLNLCPRKKLLVLGLNGLLVHRVHSRYGVRTNVQIDRHPDGIAGNFLVFNRPYCSAFLEFCFERFEVGIWSSAREWNIDGVLSTITSGLKNKVLFVWDQEQCTDSGFKSLDNKNKPIFFKELGKLWKDFNLPWPRRQYSSSNTLLIEEEPCKALLNPPNTAIFPDSYEVGNDNDTVLGPEGELREFLNGLADADNVQSYVKENRVGQPAITEAHPEWAYYSKIVHKFVKRR